MAWIESHQKLQNDAKMVSLAAEMSWSEFECIGRLHCLWWWCVDHCPDGDLTRFNDVLIARAAGVAAPDAKRFVKAMLSGVGQGDAFFERTPYFRIRNWWKFAGRFMSRRYEKEPERLAEMRARCGPAAVPQPTRRLPHRTEQNRTEPNPTQPKRLIVAKPVRGVKSPTDLTVSRSSLNRSREVELMGKLREALGEDEMARCGGQWRVTHVRKHPDKVERVLAELSVKILEGNAPTNRAAWMVDLMKRWA